MPNPNDQNAINSNDILNLKVGVVESANMLGIFIRFLSDSMHEFQEQLLNTIMFPMAAATSAMRAALAWRRARLTNFNREDTANAVVDTAAATAVNLVVATTVAASFVAVPAAIASIVVVGPLIFTGTMAAKSAWSLGSSIRSVYKAFTGKPQEKSAHLQAAKNHFIGFVAGSLATVGVAFLMVIAKPLVAAISVIGAVAGIVSSVIGLGFSLYNLVKSSKSNTRAPAPGAAPRGKGPQPGQQPTLAPGNRPGLTNNAAMHAQVRARASSTEQKHAANDGQQTGYRRLSNHAPSFFAGGITIHTNPARTIVQPLDPQRRPAP